MSGKETPLFGYRSANTPIHRVPAIGKLSALALAGFCAFSANPVIPVATGAILAVSAFLARVPLASHRRNLGIVAGYVVLIVLFRFIGPIPDHAAIVAGLEDTAVYAARLAIALLAGTVFYETTSGLEVRSALYSIQALLSRASRRLPFRRKEPRGEGKTDLALLLSLTISFIPRVFDTWDRLNRSWDARGGKTRRGFRGALSRVTTLTPLLIISLLDVAAVTERAIRNRSDLRKNS